MGVVTKALTNTDTEMSWKALQYFNLYRFFIALLFAVLIWLQKLPEPLGNNSHLLFAISAHIYLLLAIGIIFITQLHTAYHLQITAYVIIDICVLSLMMYASNGVSSGFGMLLIVAVIAGSILRTGYTAVVFAATASLVILGQEVYIHLSRYPLAPNYTHAGFLGITFFITAFLGQFLGSKVQKSEALAKKHAVDLENLGLLNESIVQRMQCGLMVLDDHYHIRLLNQSAEHLLCMDNHYSKKLSESAPELFNYINNWDKKNGPRIAIYSPPKGETEIQVSLTRLNPATEFGILIFIEDIAQIRQYAQNLKITSLGRLSASIAHEVRNPLAAISHASQLLRESNSLSKDDQGLNNIIIEHASRVNKIIENMGNISKRRAAITEDIHLYEWLLNFTANFIARKQLKENDIHIKSLAIETIIRMDADQLNQVIWNLSENALRYSQLKHHSDGPLIEYQWGVRTGTEKPYLDVIDHGTGMSEETATQLFEPFFTTDPNGSGLGLYISRELCETNRATLVLEKNTPEGCCFRIHFAHQDKYDNLL